MDHWNQLIDDLNSADLMTAAQAALSLILGGLLCWILATLLLATVSREWAIRIAPPLVRAMLVAGATVTLAIPAQASENHSPLHGLALPDRPDTQAHTEAPDSRAEPVATETHRSASRTATPSPYHVKSGDTLWSIAHAHLGPHATTKQIALAVNQWHEHNRNVIGADPNLIHPGQQLEEPRS